MPKGPPPEIARLVQQTVMASRAAVRTAARVEKEAAKVATTPAGDDDVVPPAEVFRLEDLQPDVTASTAAPAAEKDLCPVAPEPWECCGSGCSPW